LGDYAEHGSVLLAPSGFPRFARNDGIHAHSGQNMT